MSTQSPEPQSYRNRIVVVACGVLLGGIIGYFLGRDSIIPLDSFAPTKLIVTTPGPDRKTTTVDIIPQEKKLTVDQLPQEYYIVTLIQSARTGDKELQDTISQTYTGPAAK